ncbi:MAG: DUF1294 domain-containing protein [Megasphaera sp.]|jgi:uncharacterized membrane protein YsdA (DUF1294 family)|nr:DUF1294 domain-containing protein [Megasphaera sp.]MCH4188446.1 DUF1294 domain-containing protein [Megasphaera sp.]MCH4218153.1 DUF1294 domain-containing protein [Megasphaera sp.]
MNIIEFSSLLITLSALNIIAFAAFGIDKYKALHHSWRIRERTLLILALLGGSIGAIIGMIVFHHKTRHLKFRYGLPLICIIESIGLILQYVH